ncbi:yeats family-domain-containing protein [Thamnocephalis sphaerospora]|uniref:Protein AF-9 homolog n=1 Tax=Thamnocephalis sphaerospora TaxID=78915 RepID=A0A4P9XRL5_9FUNG|nr:yeats family-domain-containing protein [Thamnocephalis sphaerospora]|eukprot:RKP08151.1 yeats family-domain-containing protein [Thamnocephalis sphaerospora]
MASGSAHKRVKGVTISRPFVFGNVASLLPKTKANESDHTHRWTVQLRGVGDDDLSGILHSVTFILHETYTNSRREIMQPPYEVTETGWGEFDIGIQVQFPPETGEKPLTFYHHLRLHPYEDDYAVASTTTPNVKKKDVQAWCFDEFVFHEPTEAMHRLLTAHAGSGLPDKRTATNYWAVQTETEELQRLADAQDKVNSQLEGYQKRMATVQDELVQLKREVASLEKTGKLGRS